MVVQQDQLSSKDTAVTFEDINNTKADRILHNGTDVLKAEFQYVRPSAAYTAVDTLISSKISNPYLIDGDYSALSPVTTKYFKVEYPKVISTSEIKLYSTTLILDVNTAASGETIQIRKAFTEDTFLPVGVSDVSFTFRVDLTPQQYEYVVTLSGVEEGKYWQAAFASGTGTPVPITVSSTVTEMIVKDIPEPTISYFSTAGTELATFTMEESNLLDITYDKANNTYYTIRFNDQSVGSALDPDDDFTTTSGETSFNSVRWTESTTQSSFIRSVSNNNLVFSTASGAGRLTSNFVVSGNLLAGLDYNLTTLNSNTAYFGLHVIQEDSDKLLYGIGVTSISGSNFYKAALTSFTNNTTSADLLYLEPNLANTISGAETWTVTYVSSSNVWTVSGSVNGVQTNATTGALYSNPYISFQISASSLQSNNDNFQFTYDIEVNTRAVSSGTLDISRSGTSFSSTLGSFSETVNSNDVQIEIVGKSNVAVDLTADNFTLSGSYAYPTVPVFTIEEVDDEGVVQQEVVERFNVIKDPNKTYNDYLDGAVQLAIAGSGIMYTKVLGSIYRFSVASPLGGLVDENTVGVSVSAADVIPERGVYSFSHSDKSGQFLLYVEYDGNTQELQVKTLDDSNPPVPSSRKLFLDIPDWEEQADDESPYQIFLHSADNDTLYYLRKHGAAGLNSQKATGTTGVANGTATFTDASASFITTSKVKKGDLLVINDTGYSDNGTYVIKTVNSNTSLTLQDGTVLSTRTNTDYKVYSNAELRQFVTDPLASAFSAVNVDDASLRAGTAEQTTVTAEVINAWGEALSGKTVNFSVIQGDGVVNPASDTTDGAGQATTQYSAGSTPGTVIIQISVSD